MHALYHSLITFYRWILGLYPRHFRQEYAEEMLLVFQMQLDDVPRLDLWRTLRIMWRELRPLPVLLISAHLGREYIMMEFDGEIRAAESNPQQLEEIYQVARQSDQIGTFRNALIARYEAAPDNVLLAAWYYRLQNGAEGAPKSARTNWLIAVPLSIVTGLIFWALSDVENLLAHDFLPHLLLWWSPVAAMSALIYMAATARTQFTRAAVLGISLLVAAAYAILVTPAFGQEWAGEQYLTVAAIHIPLLCWGALGIMALGKQTPSAADRFAFLIKSIEVAIVAGLYLLAGMAFGGITIGMFAALSIELPEVLLRLIAAGGFGLLPVLAVATVYDPAAPPSAQDFSQGMSRFIATLMRLLLPLTLIVLVIYLLVIPFNFMAPFESRDVLIVYNAMLFAIVGLLVGATPIRAEDLSPKLQGVMRNGILAVAGLAVVVSVYALAAVVHRTLQGDLTLNRLTVIGWNAINIGILITLIVTQLRTDRARWTEALQRVFSRATVVYLAWGIFLLVAPPVLM